MIASLVYHGEVAVLTTSFDKLFVDCQKATVPHDFRSWVPELEIWRFLKPYDRLAAKLLLEHCADAEIETPGNAHAGFRYQMPPGCRCIPDHRLLGICESASPELVRAALRIAAKQHHPDVGGDVAVMQHLNAAADRILKRVRT